MAKRHRWRQVQDHRGGNVDPIYQRRRNGNPSGFPMIVGGALALGAGAAELHAGGWYVALGIFALLAGAVLMIAGRRLLAKARDEGE